MLSHYTDSVSGRPHTSTLILRLGIDNYVFKLSNDTDFPLTSPLGTFGKVWFTRGNKFFTAPPHYPSRFILLGAADSLYFEELSILIMSCLRSW